MRLSSKFQNYYSLYMTIVGWGGHFIFFFQAYKIISSGSAKDVSLPGFLISLFSVASWLFYGIITGNKVLVRVNIFGLIGALVCVTTILLANH